jgi:hypothetical protein
VGTINRLIEAHDLQGAYAFYARINGSGTPSTSYVRNGSFELENTLPPFDWVLSDAEGLQALMQLHASGPGGRELLLVARNGLGGELARQLLRLSPGRFRLTGLVGDVGGAEGDRPQIQLTCIQTGATPVDLRLPSSPSGGIGIRQDFTVPPAGCPFQWLRINARSRLDDDAPSPWVDDIAISALP